MEAKKMKGISPVIATILMVMITVGLVAFSYSWFMGMGQTAQTQTGAQLSQMEKSQQSFDIPTAFENNDNEICFEIRASSMNTLDIPISGNNITVYWDNVPKDVGNYAGSGSACNSLSEKLAPGASCFGNISGTCPSNDSRLCR